jgi:hypothetical protein
MVDHVSSLFYGCDNARISNDNCFVKSRKEGTASNREGQDRINLWNGGGGFVGGDGDEDVSPGVEGDSELEDKDSEFSVGSSVSDESSSSCAGGVFCGCIELTRRGAFTTFPLSTRRANELENSRGRA